MGDRRRFEVVADFVARNFAPCRVLDVAGGTGQLSYYLARRGFDCTVVDPRETDLPARLRRKARRQRVKFGRLHRRFSANVADGYDLVIGLHPDGATPAVAECAVQGRAVVLVPCCNHWPGEDGDAYEVVRRYWRRHGVRWWETRLSMGGKNVVMVARGRERRW